ncbi:S-layer homology domain-containing protein [Oscillospiraceae bacterium CM]|nr:S-layer homology domain-containing protein [Oscillospiraceae bacterium CM]
MRKKVLSWLLAVSMVLSIFGSVPLTASAASYTEYNIEAGAVIISANGDYRIYGTGASTANTIVVNTGVTANIVLDDININVSGTSNACAFDIQGTAQISVVLAAGSENTLLSGEYKAGLQVADLAQLTIDSDADNAGILNSYSGNYGAGIGGAYQHSGGVIIINNGIINANASYGAGSGIGSGLYGDDCNITINGGSITANGSGAGAGIGSGGSGDVGRIHIHGGTVVASSTGNEASYDGGSGIGSGDEGYNGEILIDGGAVTAYGKYDCPGIGGCYGSTGTITIRGAGTTVTASSGLYAAAIGGGGGIINIEGGTVTANGRYRSPGIGDYDDGTTVINISGGTVISNGGEDACGIGSGYYSEYNPLPILNFSGGNLSASHGAGASYDINAILKTSEGEAFSAGGRLVAASGQVTSIAGSVTGVFAYDLNGIATNEAVVTSMEESASGYFVLYPLETGMQIIRQDDNLSWKYASDAVQPQLTAGTVERNSDSQADITFTCDEFAGVFFEVTADGAATPDIDTSGSGDYCNGETTLHLDSLTAGACDIYLQAKDFAGNIGPIIKMDIDSFTVDVCQIGDTKYTSLADALDELTSGQTITLLSDITYNERIWAGSSYRPSLSLDLNGYELDISNVEVPIAAIDGYDILVTDSSEPGGGTLILTTTSGDSAPTGVTAVGIGSSVLVDSSVTTTITATGDNSKGVSAYNGGSVEIGSGNITSDTYGIYTYGMSGDTASLITFTGNITATGVDSEGLEANSGGEITINGNVSGGRYGALAMYAGTISVSGNVTAFGNLSPQYSAAAAAEGNGSSVAVGGNATVTGSYGYGALANNGGVVTVGGDVSATGTGCYGVYAIGYDYGGEITIDGTIDAATYISVGGNVRTPNQTDESPAKAGYLTYSYGDPASTVWVKNQFSAFVWVVTNQGAEIATGPAKLGIPDGPLTSIRNVAEGFWMSGADFVGTQLYGVSYGEGNSGLYKINEQTGEYELVDYTGSSLTGFTYDAQNQVAYAIGQVNTYNYLYTVDLETGVSTPMGILDGPYLIVDIAVDNAGNLYGLDINNDALLSINPSTAAVTQIGSLGLNINYAQDIAYDRDNGVLYGTLYAYDGGSHGLYIINTSTGLATLKYAFDGNIEVDSFAIPYIPATDTDCIVPGCTTSTDDGGFTEFTMIGDEKYYHISTAAQLAHINEHLDLNYIQTADIDLAQYNGGLWNPIGGYLGSDWFTGRYLGDGHKIENMKIDVTSPDGSIIYAGLFGLTSPSAHIEGINLEIDSMSAAQGFLAYGEVYLGGIAATHRSTATIEDCHVSLNGNVSATSDGGNVYVGGIAGYNSGNISDCSTATSTASTVTVAARGKEAFVGGIAGYTSGNVLNSDNSGKLHAEAASDTYTRRVYVGGIVGYAVDSSTDTIIENCQNDADIESINNCDVENTYRAYAGGIVGHIYWNDSAQSVIIRNCANISKDKQVYTKAPSTLTGGIAGSARFVPQTNIKIENCYNRSNVISDMLNFNWNKGPEYCTGVTAGGIIGAAGGIRVQNCYSSAADISATATTGEDAYEGGIAGLIWGTMLSEDYYETNANVAVGIGGAVDSSMAIVLQADLAGEAEGATAAQLQTKSFYGDSWQWYTSGGTEPAYYSSTDPWRFAAADSYPVLRGLPYTPTPPSGGSSYTPSTYRITSTANVGGAITPAGNSIVTEYGSITFTIKPDKNYIIKDVLVDGASIGTVTTYTFSSVRSNHTIEAIFAHDCPSKPFTDVDITQWYHEGIDYVLLAGLFKGTSATTFEPNTSMTRAMLVTVLHRLEGTPAATGNTFSDVASGKWYTNAVVWANVKGIVKGYDSDTFGTNDFITREQLATILYRYAQYKGYDVIVGEDTNILSYEDAFNISEYAIPAVQWACGAGIMQGDAAKLDPQGNATRAQVAAMLMRFIENVVK